MRHSSSTLACLLSSSILALSLLTTGCGQTQADSGSSTPAQEEAAEDTSEDTGEQTLSMIEVPEELSAQSEIVRSVSAGTDAQDSGDISDLPTREDDLLETLAPEGDIETGLEDASKAPSGKTLLIDGGIQMAIPSSWLISQDEDSFVMQDPRGDIVGYMYSTTKPAGASYDLESMAASIPLLMADRGYTDIEIVSFETYYTRSGRPCSSLICYGASYNGVDFLFYTQFVESKSYLNCVEFAGTLDGFYNNLSDIADATDSIAFNSGEAL